MRTNRLRVLSGAGLIIGWIGLQLAPSLPDGFRQVAFGAGWAALMIGWMQLSPCAGGACAIPSAPRKAETAAERT